MRLPARSEKSCVPAFLRVRGAEQKPAVGKFGLPNCPAAAINTHNTDYMFLLELCRPFARFDSIPFFYTLYLYIVYN